MASSGDSLADLHEVAQSEIFGHAGTGRTADDRRFHACQFTFVAIGKAAVQLLADNGTEDRIAEKLQSFVRTESRPGSRRMGQTAFEQIEIIEPVAQNLFAVFQIIVGQRPHTGSLETHEMG